MKRSQSLLDFLSPERSFVRYVVGTATLTVAIQTIYDVVTGQLSTYTRPLILVASLIVIAGVMFRWDYVRARRAIPDPKISPIRAYKRLILLVSPGNLEAPLKTIEHHIPVLEQLWLVSTPESLPTADELVKQVHQRWPQVLAHPTADYVVEANDLRLVWEKISAILKQIEAPGSEVITDITGGTKIMSVGAALACLGQDQNLGYLYTPASKPGSRPVAVESTPIQVSMDWLREIE
jgi:hypothetical protein